MSNRLIELPYFKANPLKNPGKQVQLQAVPIAVAEKMATVREKQGIKGWGSGL